MPSDVLPTSPLSIAFSPKRLLKSCAVRMLGFAENLHFALLLFKEVVQEVGLQLPALDHFSQFQVYRNKDLPWGQFKK